MPADSATVTSTHEIPSASGAPPTDQAAPQHQKIPFEADQAVIYNTTETAREQAEDLPETADIPNLLAPPETLPALSIIPVIHLDPLSLAFGLRYEGLYDNNILLSKNGEQLGDFEHVIAPRVSFRLGDAPPKQYNWLGDAVTKDYNYLAVSYEPKLIFFQHYDQYNAVDQEFRLNGQYQFSKTVLKETLVYNHTTDPDREIQGRVSRDILANETDAIYQATDRVAFELDGTALVRKYEDQINSDEGRLRLWTRYRAADNWTVSLGAGGGVLLPDQGASQVYEQVYLGAATKIGPSLSAFLSVGGDFREPDRTNHTVSKPISTPIFDAEIVYEPSTETQVKLRAIRQIFNDPFMIDQNFISTRVSVIAIQRLWQTYQISAEVGYENADYYQFGTGSAGNRADNYPTARFEFNYARFQDLEAGVFYQIEKNFSSSAVYPTRINRRAFNFGSDTKLQTIMIMTCYKLRTGGYLAASLCWVLLAAVANGQATNRTLSAGDSVQVTVYQDPALNTVQQVSTDGTIEMFYIGSVQVRGITTQAAAAKIAQKLFEDKYIKNAQVRVSVDTYVSEVVTVKGEVNRPGQVTLPTDRSIDLLEAIASAGGETRAGDLAHVEVRRTKDGKSSTQKINLKDLGNQNQVFVVQPGDVITVGIRMF